MPRKPQVSVEPRPDGRWAVQTDGTQRAYRVKDGKLMLSDSAAQAEYEAMLSRLGLTDG